ncbi:hypothetical protein [Kitasatospora sp. NBC_00458]|uniref:hypothetical protein n=1 Tax=Kitasatospora sp. NBC_00458 TaxID=2903568 RepID=UPI002E170D7C
MDGRTGGSDGRPGGAAPPLRSRPAARWPVRGLLVRGLLVLCSVATVVAVGWTVVGVVRFLHPPETDADRAQRIAGLHHEQHPGKGRYYVPAEGVVAGASDGTRVAYLHYRVVGGDDSNLDDFLRTYDLPRPGAAAPLPEDLRAALPGEEPAEGGLLPGVPGGPERWLFVVASPGGFAGAVDVYVRAVG